MFVYFFFKLDIRKTNKFTLTNAQKLGMRTYATTQTIIKPKIYSHIKYDTKLTLWVIELEIE